MAHPESKADISIYYAVLGAQHQASAEGDQKSNDSDVSSPDMVSESKNADEFRREYVITASEDGTTRSFMLQMLIPMLFLCKEEAVYLDTDLFFRIRIGRLFSETGVLIGIFGQDKVWDVNDPKIFVAAKADYVEDLPEIEEDHPESTTTDTGFSTESLESEALKSYVFDAEVV